MRVVVDYDVDRAQVYRRRRQSRALLIARELAFVTDCPGAPGRVRLEGVFPYVFFVLCVLYPCLVCDSHSDGRHVISGGYCGGVPPLPIPNREVKPACADGTAMQCGRVGGRLLFFMSPLSGETDGGDFFVCLCVCVDVWYGGTLPGPWNWNGGWFGGFFRLAYRTSRIKV